VQASDQAAVKDRFERASEGLCPSADENHCPNAERTGGKGQPCRDFTCKSAEDDRRGAQ
jgi:hypothetical protein